MAVRGVLLTIMLLILEGATVAVLCAQQLNDLRDSAQSAATHQTAFESLVHRGCDFCDHHFGGRSGPGQYVGTLYQAY